jgi:putative ABC transport system permease protein
MASMIGVAGGTCGALAVTRLLRSQLYGIAPNDPAVYVVSIVLLMVPVLIATIRPALIAASVNPIEALRVD